MKKILNKLRDGLLFGLGFVIILGITNAWVDLGNVTSGEPLTETLWNNMVIKLNETGNRVSGIFTDGIGNVGIGNELPTSKLDVSGTTNTTEITGPWDSSDNGYIRLGDVQIAWGLKYSSSVWPQVVTYPMPFSIPPVVTVSDPRSGFYTTNGTAGTNPTSTGFSCYVMTAAGATAAVSTTCHWIAIGKWR